MTHPLTPQDNAEIAHEWREANKLAIISSNEWVEAHGLPLADLRRF